MKKPQKTTLAWTETFESKLRKYSTGNRQYSIWKLTDVGPFGGELFVIHGHLWAATNPQKQTKKEKQAQLVISPDDLMELDRSVKATAKVMGRIERHTNGMMAHMRGLISEMGANSKVAPEIAAMPHIAGALGIYRALLGSALGGVRVLDPKQTQSSNLVALALFLEARNWKFTMRGLAECLWAAAEATGSEWAPSGEAIEKRIREYRRNHARDYEWLKMEAQSRSHSGMMTRLYGMRTWSTLEKPTEMQ